MGADKVLQLRETELEGAAPSRVALAGERALLVTPGDGGAKLQVCAPSGRVELEVEIVITPAGAVLRARAAALALETAGRIEARCAEFVVDASERIALRSGGEVLQRADGDVRVEASAVDVVARSHGVRVKANDDVQLLGEHVLLNCDAPQALPDWVPVRPLAEATAAVDVAAASGDRALLEALGLSK